MLPNEEFALACRAYYDEIGLVVDEKNGQFAHCPYPKDMGEQGYYLLWEHHQQQGLLQSRDVGECCFFIGDAKKWLTECDPFPDNYFELWDIYTEFSLPHCKKAAKTAVEIVNSKKDQSGRSINAVKGAEALNAEKDEFGRSINAVEAAKKCHQEKDELGRSINAVRSGNLAKLKTQRGVKLSHSENGQVFIFESVKLASELLKIHYSSICAVCKGKRKTVGGYTATYWDG